MFKIKNCFKVQKFSGWGATAMLMLRLVVGVAFLLHGWGKIQSPFGWMPPDAGVPGVLQFLAAISEFGGGLSLILGLLVPLSMLGLAFTMATATIMHAVVLKDPFVASGAGQASFEPALVYFALCLVMISVGPGQISLDFKIFGQKN